MLIRLCLLLAIFALTTTPPASGAGGGSAACQFTITPLNQSFPAAGGSGSVTLSSSEPQCAWTARSNAAWITITSPMSGTGNGRVDFTVAPAVSPRNGTLTIGGRIFTVWQSVNACDTASFALPAPLLPTPGLLKFVPGDFNGDNRTDLVTFAHDGQFKLSFASARSDAGLNAPQPLSLGFTPQNTTAMKAADFNHDRKLDLLFVDPSLNKVYVLLGDGSGGFGAAAPSDISSSPQVYPASTRQTVIADLNNDRIPDIVASDGFTARLSVLIGNGAGGFNPPLTVTPAETNARALMLDAGDFNGDGKADLIYLINGSFQFLLLPGDGTGGFGRGTLVSFIDGSVSGFVEPTDLAIGDATGDGRADVVVTHSKGLSVAPGNGAGGFGEAAMLLREPCGPSNSRPRGMIESKRTGVTQFRSVGRTLRSLSSLRGIAAPSLSLLYPR